jgi:hypothetical protein
VIKKILLLVLAFGLLPVPGRAIVCGFGLGGGMSLPIGCFADAAGLSVVGAGDLAFCITPKFFVNVRGAYRVKHAGKEGDFSTKGEYKSIVFWAGPAYRFDFYPILLFVGGGAGVSKNNFTYPYEDAQGMEHTGTTKDLRPIVYGGGGMDYRLTEKVSLELSGDISTMLGGESPGGVRAALKEGALAAVGFTAMLKYYLM